MAEAPVCKDCGTAITQANLRTVERRTEEDEAASVRTGHVVRRYAPGDPLYTCVACAPAYLNEDLGPA